MWKQDMKLLKTSFFSDTHTKNNKVLRYIYLIEVVLFDFFYFVFVLLLLLFFVGSTRKLTLELFKYIAPHTNKHIHTPAKSINFHRHYILNAVHHSDMRQTKVNKQSKHPTTTTATKSLGIISIWSFVAVTQKLCHSVRHNTFIWVQ